jgi:glycosyltransferase involved in cell wall biosynthesis
LIFHLISSLGRGGKERQLAVITKHSDNNKYPPKIICLKEVGESYLKEYDIEHKKVKINSRGFFRRLVELNNLIKHDNPKIIYSWGNLESILILLLQPFHNFIFINGSIRHGIRSNKFWHFVRTFILHISKVVVANSKAGLMAEKLNRGYVLYNGIDENNYKILDKHEKIKKRKKLFNVPEESIFFVSLANMFPYKDYFSILACLLKLKQHTNLFYYMILGDGPLRPQIEQTIQKYDLSSNIKIIGHVQNVQDYLGISDYFIHSSKGEGCSNAILEAMFAGLPIIATNIGGTSELVYEKSCALFDYKDINKLTEILLNIKNIFTDFDPKSKDYKKHLEQFTIETMINNYYKILEEVTSKSK